MRAHWQKGIGFGLFLGLAACGGGGSTSSTSALGNANVALTDGPGAYSHVWVTLNRIAFHTNPNAVWNPQDAGWISFSLPAPVTVDLAALNNGVLSTSSGGTLAQLFQGLSLPAGTYRQVRFFFDGAGSALDSSAQAFKDTNGNALTWNDQVERLTSSTGPATEYPLEIPFPTQGIQLNGTFQINTGSSLNLAIDFDLNKSLVPFKHAGMRAYTMNPVLHYFDLSQVGAINGKVDATQLCSRSANGAALMTSNCAYNLVVKAEAVVNDPATGIQRFASLRTTSVRPDGTFTLYPLAVNDINGNPIDYHVLVRGRNMQTLVIKHVPVTVGTSPTSGATLLPATGVLPVTAMMGTGYSAQLNAALTPLSSGYMVFMQTDTSESYPYSVRYAVTDPFSGLLYDPEPLEHDGLLTTVYSTSPLSFTPATIKEGSGNYSVGVNDFGGYTMSSALTSVLAPSGSPSTTFTYTAPSLASNLVAGTLSGTITVSAASLAAYDHVQWVLSRGASVMTAQDLSSQLAGNTSGSIAYTQSSLPAGSATQSDPAAYYYAYLRVWNSNNPWAIRIVPLNGYADMRTNATAKLNGSL
ncbi:MAG: DUF4382 domain-containing protein [Pseudomonadales bacterium]|nr:DUF4382 domain-containing protein [Pseudomonadales bacterium]